MEQHIADLLAHPKVERHEPSQSPPPSAERPVLPRALNTPPAPAAARAHPGQPAAAPPPDPRAHRALMQLQIAGRPMVTPTA